MRAPSAAGEEKPGASMIFDFPVFSSPINKLTRRASNFSSRMDLSLRIQPDPSFSNLCDKKAFIQPFCERLNASENLILQTFPQLLFQYPQRRLFRVRHSIYIQIKCLLKLMLAGGDSVRDRVGEDGPGG